MEPKFNINRPKISDEEINKRKDFDKLVRDFKAQSLKKAQGDESWRKNKKVRYSTVIAGVTFICTITLFTLLKTQNKKNNTHETIITSTSASTATKSSVTQKAFIHSPSERLKIPYSQYKINGSKGGSITHHTASKINIPAGSFVNKQGETITGDVTIEYREFHDPADIVASGIPMAYDSAGKHYNLESAGMFDIRGYYNGEPVFITPQKELQITLTSLNAENRFNQYYLDTVARNWHYLKKDEAQALALADKKAEQKAEARLNSPKMLAMKQEIETVIPHKIDSVKTIYVRKAQKLPRPKEPFKPSAPTGRPTIRFDASNSEFPELAVFNNVIFEVGEENTNYTKDFHKITWSNVRISMGPAQGTNYNMYLTYRDRVEKLVVYPVLTGDDLEKAKEMYAEKVAVYEELSEKRQQAEKMLMDEMQAKQQAYFTDLKKKQEQYDKERSLILARVNALQENELAGSFNTLGTSAKASRLFSVSRFGIYNSDCPHAEPQSAEIHSPVFMANGRVVNPDFIYLVDHNTRSVYNISQQSGFKMKYVPENNYSICVFNKNELFLCSKAAFKEAIGRGDKTFQLNALPEGADNLPDFKKALEI